MRFSAVLALFLFATATAAVGEIRLGVVCNEAKTGAFSDLLEVVLSQEETIELLDRAQLHLIADELSIPASERRSVTLKSADFLVFVELLQHDEKNGVISMRLVKGGTGQSILHRLVPAGEDAISDVPRLGGDVIAAVARASDSDQIDNLLVSLAGLRFDTPVSNAGSFEYAFNQLISARLASLPSVSVLERWRVGDLLWEQTLADSSKLSLQTAGLIVDGVLSERGELLHAKVNFRHPGQADIRFKEFSGKRSELPSLVSQVVEAVRKEGALEGAGQNTDFQNEAKRYRKLAEWALGVSLAEEALSAAQVAYSLDPENSHNLSTLVRSFLYQAWPINIEVDHVGNVLNYQGIDDVNFDWAGRLAAAASGLDLWLNAVGEGSLKAPTGTDAIHSYSFLGLNSRTPVVWLMRKAIDARRVEELAPQLTELREKYSKVISHLAEVDDPDFRWSVISANLPWVGYWSETPEKAVANARWIMQWPINDGSNRLSSSRMLWGMQLEQEFVPVAIKPIRGRRIVFLSQNSEILVSNRGDSREEIIALWNGLAAELLEEDGYRENFDGAMLYYYLNNGRMGASPALEKACDTIWKHRALFASFEECPSAMELNFCFEKSTTDEVPEKYRDFNERFLAYLLDESDGIGTFCLSSLASKRVDWSGVARSKFAVKLENYRKRLNVPGKIRSWHLDQLAKIELSMGEGAPAPGPASEFKGLTLTDCFHPFHSNHRLVRYQTTVQNSFAFGSAFFWCIDKSGLYQVDPKSSRPGKVYEFPGEWGTLESSLAVFSDAVFVSGKDGIWKMQRDSGEWKKINFPGDSLLKLRRSGSRLFVLFGPKRGSADQGKGIAELNRDDHRIDVLVSSRRNPPQHVLDGRADLTPFGAFQWGERTAVSLTGENKNGQSLGYLLQRGKGESAWKTEKGNLAYPVAIQETESGSLLCLGGRWSGSPEISQIGFFPHSGGDAVFLAATKDKPMHGNYRYESFAKDRASIYLPESFKPASTDVSLMVAATYHKEHLILISCDRSLRGSIRDGAQNEIKAAGNHSLHVVDKAGNIRTTPLRFEGSHNLKERQMIKMTEDEAQCFYFPSFSADGIGVVNDTLLISGGSYKGSVFGFWKIPLTESFLAGEEQPGQPESKR